ncbi:MAG: heparan-alpha-glucosaminide N-acetyltransferase domain-containing protein [Trichodesmium sp. St19_bin2]|nr:heparan-alpha-glucosaminide N-acetyltransferase domain-containing protein [Trichodesmium sp. St18_bin3_1_1]MDE5104831.1 heparan-alpha-glucosaminide N-acetyltransferase domain-containing protein [Trichodesmium sp. St19_bin2]
METPNTNQFILGSKNQNQSPIPRVISIDILRGVVMVLMTLDHVRFFFSNADFNPLDLTQSNIPLFLTRWVTHICAPTFIFLAGIGAYLSLKRGKSKPKLCRFLLLRGLWLVFLDLTVVTFSWSFNLRDNFFVAGVLWAIGWSMVFLAAVIYLPTRTIAAIGILMIVGHNFFDHVQAEQLGNIGWVWAILHERKILELTSGFRLFILYPLIPWIGVMAVGYAFGTLLEIEKNRRLQLLRKISLSMIVTFIIIRVINSYGDPNPWLIQSRFFYTLLSFLNCHKYPPSLLYLLITLGLAILLLYFLEKSEIRYFKPLIILGQQPLFFYVIHFWLIHITAILFALSRYGITPFTFSQLGISWKPKAFGYDLPIVYLIWLLMTVILYIICERFAKYKKKHRGKWWLNYL